MGRSLLSARDAARRRESATKFVELFERLREGGRKGATLAIIFEWAHVGSDRLPPGFDFHTLRGCSGHDVMVRDVTQCHGLGSDHGVPADTTAGADHGPIS